MFYPNWVYNVFVPGAAILVSGFSFSVFSGNVYESKEYKKHSSPLTPPWWIFALAWTLLYLLLSAVIALVLSDTVISTGDSNQFIVLFVLQMAFNLLWTPVFAKNSFYGAIVLVFCHFSTIWMMVIGFVQSTASLAFIAACLLCVYEAWLIFALFLNLWYVVALYLTDKLPLFGEMTQKKKKSKEERAPLNREDESE